VNITFIGGGNMARAIIGGLLARGFAPDAIGVVELIPEARLQLQREFGVRAFASPGEGAPYGELVVMAVKPQQMHSAASQLAPHLSGQLVVSIAAGIRLADLSRWLGGHRLLVRCMPNTPALIGAGITAVYASPGVADAQREAAAKVLEAVGKVLWVEDEALLDPVTAVSGSGPAYVYYFIEAMQQAAADLGLTPEQARALSLETFLGAAKLAAASPEPVSVLRERVTSKGGTTEAALASLAADHVREAIVRAARAASERGRQLGLELGKD
jgi:pyrroline-5-carboxylate reductase